MKREIKFRAWYSGCLFPFDPTDLEDYEKPQMIYNVQYLYDGKGCGNKSGVLGGRSSFGSLLDDELFTIMQFTGLHDKNGKEIYEGDILKCGYGIGKVIYNAGCFMIEWIDDKESMMEFVFSRDGIYSRRHEDEFLEIIGNINENPDLK